MQPRIPHSYDQITRDTVVDPDGSLRPPNHNARLPDRALWQCVSDALIELNSSVGFKIADRDVILRGRVPDASTARRIEHAIAEIDGVEKVWNHLTVG